MTAQICYAAVRKCEGIEFIDSSTVSLLPEDALEKSKRDPAPIQSTMPVVRVAAIQMQEIAA